MVDNGSRDTTAEVLKELLPQYSFAKMVFVPVNQGYGYGILQGLKEADGDYIGWTHADMQTDPADVIKAYEIIQERGQNNLFVKGNRKGRRAIDNFFTNGMSLYESIIFRTKMNDINAQPNIFPRTFLEFWEKPPCDFALDLYAFYMAREKGLEVVRFPVLFPDRIYGKSKWNTEGVKSKKNFIKRTMNFSRELRKGLK